MAPREIRVAGREALTLVTELLQRVRRTDPQAGLWEAADLQWLWRKPRESDDIDQLFWLDDHGPVAGVFLSSWTGAAWQCDPIVVPHVSGPDPEVVWERALDHAAVHAGTGLEVPVRDDDPVFTTLAERSGLVVGERSSVAWMDVSDPVTKVGLVEPVRVEEAFQRQGLAKAMLTAGLERLATQGAHRAKIGFRIRRSRRPVPEHRLPTHLHSHLVPNQVGPRRFV